MSGAYVTLPQYRRDTDYANQEGYQELLNLLLTQWFAQNGSNVQTLFASLSGTFTAAQIDAAYTTPITLLPAPGANIMIVVQLFVLELVYGGTAFANGGNSYLQYGVAGASSNYATVASNIPNTFMQGTASATISTPGTINTTSGLATTITNNAPISFTNDTGVFTGGAGSSVNWYLWYSTIGLT